MANGPMDQFLTYLNGSGMDGSFQPYAAGRKVYGGGRSAPNVGPVTNTQGYRERDLRQRAMKQRMLKKLKKKREGAYADPAVLRNQQPESYRQTGY